MLWGVLKPVVGLGKPADKVQAFSSAPSPSAGYWRMPFSAWGSGPGPVPSSRLRISRLSFLLVLFPLVLAVLNRDSSNSSTPDYDPY